MEYLKEAKKYYNIALQELAESKENAELELAVDACDKGWLALNLALKGMFVLNGVNPKHLPKSYRGTSYFLKKYGTRELRKLVNSAYGRLHIQGFWERDIDYEMIEEVIDDVKNFIDSLDEHSGV